MPLINRCGGGGSSFAAVIQVTYNSGAVCTCANGSTTLTAPDTSGSVNFKVKRKGTWTITVELGGRTKTKAVSITTDGQIESLEVFSSKIYGISRNITNSSPEWARTDNAVGFTATASVGTAAGSSSFDNCYPWSGIVRETLSTGDVMVKIPKFWYRRFRSGNIEHIQIADAPTPNFELHPAFNHAGEAKDYLYVGAYKTSSNNKSVSGAVPTAQTDMDTARSKATSKGTGWGLMDISTLSAIQMLILVEFANNNVQLAIGKGYANNNPMGSINVCSTGTCDNVPRLTGSLAKSPSDVVWRGIEGFWGNLYEFVDGVLGGPGGKYYVCNNPSQYTSQALTGYTECSYGTGVTVPGGTFFSEFITQEGLDINNSYVILPSSTVGTGSSTTYECDTFGSSSYSDSDGIPVFRGGDTLYENGRNGLFCTVAHANPGRYTSNIGSRLIYIPQEAAS